MTFTSGGSTLCIAALPATSCDTPTSLAPGTYPVTATYSGDSNYNGATVGGAGFVVTKADTAMTESAAPASIAYGAQDTLSVAGLPGDATGSVTFASGGSTLCVAPLPAISCQTATTLAPGTYPVTAIYSGDANYNGTTAGGASFVVTKADPAFTEFSITAEHPVRVSGHCVHGRSSRGCNRDRDVHLGWSNPLHGRAARAELPDVGHPVSGDVPGDRDLFRG